MVCNHFHPFAPLLICWIDLLLPVFLIITDVLTSHELPRCRFPLTKQSVSLMRSIPLRCLKLSRSFRCPPTHMRTCQIAEGVFDLTRSSSLFEKSFGSGQERGSSRLADLGSIHATCSLWCIRRSLRNCCSLEPYATCTSKHSCRISKSTLWHSIHGLSSWSSIQEASQIFDLRSLHPLTLGHWISSPTPH